MALDREPTLTKGNIQEIPLYFLQKGEILKRHTCESKTLRVKVQQHHGKWEWYRRNSAYIPAWCCSNSVAPD